MSNDKEPKKVKESKTKEGRRVIKIKQEGSKPVQRLDHDTPSWMRSEE